MNRRSFRPGAIAATLAIILAIMVAPDTVTQPAVAAPLAQQAVITSPQALSAVRGRVTVEGTAVHPSFQRYEMYFSREPVRDDSWVFIGDAHPNQVANGFLGTWETGGVPDGVYSLRLRVVRQDGNYDEYIVRGLQVANAQPAETATPTVTPTATVSPTPLPPTPTILVEAPVISTPTAEAGQAPDQGAVSTPTPETVTPASQPEQSQGTDSLPSPLSPQGLAEAFWSGGRWTVITFAVVGVVFGAKWLLGWAWQYLRRKA